MKHLDITLDLETTSLSSHAAILQIAAVAWDRFSTDAEHMFFGTATKPDETPHFCKSIDLNSQFVEGLWDFSQSTSDWWRRQKDEAKRAVIGRADIIKGKDDVSVWTHINDQTLLNDALADLDEWVKKMLQQAGADDFCLWCQGTDFDIPILRYAAEQTHCDKLLPMALHHKYFRDCRTAIYESVASWLGTSDGNQPYSRLDLLHDPLLAYKILPQLPASFGGKDNAHGALYDCIRSSWFTWQVLRLI